MLFSAERESRPSETATTAAPRREMVQGNHLLHDFSLPIMKSWGNQHVVRCMGMSGEGEAVDGGAGVRRPYEAGGGAIRDPEAGGGDDGGIEEVREKLLVHLREAADRMKLVGQPRLPPHKGGEPAMEEEREAEEKAQPSSSAAVWPWKLRTRRRGSRAPASFEMQASEWPPAAAQKRAVRPRSGNMEQRERPDFSITLTREEIEEDIYAVTGYRARRRPRRRPRVVQKQLDLLFPGSWLSEITVDSYRVPESR